MNGTVRALVAIVASVAAPASMGAAPADRFASVRESIQQEMQAKNVAGLSLAVWQNGKIVWEEGFGWADRERRVPATEHTMFSLASLSKSMTATALMTLVQQGKVDLDAPINDYLGEDAVTVRIGDPKQVTVRRVANHTSGLAEGEQFFYGDERRLIPSMQQTIHRYGVVMAPPGERYGYSNIGYGVLGELIAKVSGRSYADYLREAVFLPLGMTHSSVDIGAGLAQYAAIRYDNANEPIPNYGFAEPASAAVYSSAHDLARFGMFFLKQRQSQQRAILNDASIDHMTDQLVLRATPRAEPGSRYGVGWVVSERGGYRFIGHGGSMSGVNTNMSMVPETKTGVVVLVNAGGDAWAERIRDRIFAILLPQRPSTMPPAAAATSTATATAFRPSSELLGVWAGKIHTYEGDLPMSMKVLASGDIHVKVGSGSGALETLLNGARFNNDELTGEALSQISTADTQRYPHTVSIRLKLRGQTLNGSVAAVTDHPKFFVYALPYWTELFRVTTP
ncbi:serine hydrolase domain-containing protein [Steroidobacter sp.]|uniref:serine hydrolase domain-containing protein n=1 Tax=Steroidobacter sp. TaxID=1978227 RepID=UPI001A5751D4|nr:serine hydrolase domain-containing protein [Steroidobacter sp.]MBL8264727.1 beta-lactamase family protein [Steroidobacter sp.]